MGDFPPPRSSMGMSAHTVGSGQSMVEDGGRHRRARRCRGGQRLEIGADLVATSPSRVMRSAPTMHEVDPAVLHKVAAGIVDHHRVGHALGPARRR